MNTEKFTYTFNPARYHTSLAEVRELMGDTIGRWSDETPEGNIIVRYTFPETLFGLMGQLGQTKKLPVNDVRPGNIFKTKPNTNMNTKQSYFWIIALMVVFLTIIVLSL